MLECPQFDDIRAQYPDLLQDARDSMRNLMWHPNQKALSDFADLVVPGLGLRAQAEQHGRRAAFILIV